MQQVPVVRVGGLGILGGEVGMAFALLVAAILGAVRGYPLDWPLRLGASVVLGDAALAETHPLAVILIGSALLAALGALAGIWFAFMCNWFPGLAATPGTLVLAGVTYAALLWLFGFYLIGLLLWPWLTQTDPVVFFGAAIAGGASLGGSFALAGVHRSSRLD